MWGANGAKGRKEGLEGDLAQWMHDSMQARRLRTGNGREGELNGVKERTANDCRPPGREVARSRRLAISGAFGPARQSAEPAMALPTDPCLTSILYSIIAPEAAVR